MSPTATISERAKALPRAVARRPINPWVIALTVTLATFMELLDTSIANVSLPYIAGGLGRSYDEVTWILTTYLVANAVVLPMSAWLSRVLGRQNYYRACVALFTITSFLFGIAPILGIILVPRLRPGCRGRLRVAGAEVGSLGVGWSAGARAGPRSALCAADGAGAVCGCRLDHARFPRGFASSFPRALCPAGMCARVPVQDEESRI